MSRHDSVGLFWEEVVEPKKLRAKVAKVVEKRHAPERIWENADYLPDLEQAKAFNVELFGDDELVMCARQLNHVLVFDIESYPNYFLIAFRSVELGKALVFEQSDGCNLDTRKVAWVARNFCLVGFNSKHYDIPMLQLAIAGKSASELFDATQKVIVDNVYGSDLTRECENIAINHVDLIEVAPGQVGLKLYGGRLHCKRMWDLPFKPGTILSEDQAAIVRWYCINDLDLTELLYRDLTPQINLRETMSVEYGMDLRSKSDAQIAETVISSELQKLIGRVYKPSVEVGTVYKYQVPAFISFETDAMRAMLSQLADFEFVVADDGYVRMPDALSQMKITIGSAQYQMGMGGLHSCEKGVSYWADDETYIIDRDVASYYPSVILNLQLAPEHLGKSFLDVYSKIVERRLAAKAAGNKVVTDSLKIAINGSFGKLGSKWSVLYSPNLLFQVTITGQLCLFMLIEKLEINEISVISANTDGVVFKCAKRDYEKVQRLIEEWEKQTSFTTEETRYRSIHSRDVNTYIAIKTDNSVKTKGEYGFGSMSKNPNGLICVEAVVEYLKNGTPVADTIRACSDITKFITVRTVSGGAVRDSVYLGKAIRWYISTSARGEIIYAKNGNKVPQSENAMPVMTLPDSFPLDVDFDHYIRRANEILEKINAISC